MIADHGDVFWYDSTILPTVKLFYNFVKIARLIPTMSKSFRNLVPDIEIALHPWPSWAPLSVVSLMVSVWHRVHWKDLCWICFL